MILDVGSGHRPHPKATILSDISLGASHHRDGAHTQLDSRPFVICSMEALPFRTHVIDLVYSNHALEHVDNPDHGLAEMKRAGKRGFVAIPSKWKELVFVTYHPGHHWIINEEGKPLDITKPHYKALRKLLHRVFTFNCRIQLRAKVDSLIKGRWRENFVKW